MTSQPSADSGGLARGPIHRPPPRAKASVAARPAPATPPLPMTPCRSEDAAVDRIPRNLWILMGGICLTAVVLGILAAAASRRIPATQGRPREAARAVTADRAADPRAVGQPSAAPRARHVPVQPAPRAAEPSAVEAPLPAVPPAVRAEIVAAALTSGSHDADPVDGLDVDPVDGLEADELPTPPVAARDPLGELPRSVDLPLPHARGRAPSFYDLGPLPLEAGQAISFGLLGGDQIWGGEGGFEIEPSETPRCARVLMATVGSNRLPSRIVSVAQLAVAEDRLRFLWLVDNSLADAVYLRNCVLKVSVGDSARHLALRTPLRVPSLVVDVRNGGVTFQGRVEHLPRREAVWLEMAQLSQGFPAHQIEGQWRLAPEQKTTIRLLGKTQHDLLLLQVAFGARRHGQVTVAVRPLTPDGRRFDPRVAERQLAALQTQLGALHARYESLSPDTRPALQTQYQQQTAALERQITAFAELDEACQRLLAAPLAFRVFLKNPETEIDLVCGTPDPASSGECAASAKNSG